jgi:hypothetical protein
MSVLGSTSFSPNGGFPTDILIKRVVLSGAIERSLADDFHRARLFCWSMSAFGSKRSASRLRKVEAAWQGRYERPLSRKMRFDLGLRYNTIPTGIFCVIESTVAALNQRLGGFSESKLHNPN